MCRLDRYRNPKFCGCHIVADAPSTSQRCTHWALSIKSSAEAFAATARNVQEFAELGEADVLSFTPVQRKRAGDEYTQKHLDQGGGMDPS